jgi:hypothetical protein
MDEIITTRQVDIKSLILTIRDTQVLLDRDVAMLYGYGTKRINEAANRNKERFPEDFRFQLTKEEVDYIERLRSQIATSNDEQRGGRRYRPYVYTEQGIAMLSGLLKNDVAIQVSIGIMQAFVEMRRFISAYGKAFERLSTVEYKLIEHDKKFDELFDLIQLPQEFRQGIFFKGQIYDAFKFLMDIIKSADHSIVIIDNYADSTVLDMLTDKKTNVVVTIVTGNPNRISKLAIRKFASQYPDLHIVESKDYHDRFIIVDHKKLFHIGASLKDAGKKCFGITLIEDVDYLSAMLKQSAFSFERNTENVAPFPGAD